jgi:chromosome transmission fidelity protein 1
LPKREKKIRDWKDELLVMNRLANAEYVVSKPRGSHADMLQKLQDRDEESIGEAEFLLDDYESDNDSKQNSSSALDLPDLGLSADTQKLLKKLGLSANGGLQEAEEEPDDEGVKIFYSSRTHSQLAQFAAELRRVKMPPVIDPDPPDSQDAVQENSLALSEEFRHLTLGSRKNLCINPRVNKLSSANAINEKCLDLQKSGTSTDQKCSFLPNKDNKVLTNQFRDHAVAKIRDIEDLGDLGKKLGICPYYASRPAISISEVRTAVITIRFVI